MIREVWTNADGETVRVDINGRTVKEVDHDGRNLIFTDEKGNETRTDYDEKENLTRILYPDNTEVNFAYDLRFNKVSQITDPLAASPHLHTMKRAIWLKRSRPRARHRNGC